jgi:ankyrin repeat protein
MRLPLALLLLFPIFSHALRAVETPPLRAALLAWEPVPARPDIQRVASGLVALAQAELSAERDFEWVERAELDKHLAEIDLSASGQLAPRASLRIGKLARAQILLTGRLDANDPAKTALTLEAVDLDRGDLLATATTPLPARPHKHFSLRDEDRTAALAALRAVLAEAREKRLAQAGKPAVALLFLANSGPLPRLDPAAAELASGLRAAAASAGARTLEFPRVDPAREERSLAVLGLAEADPGAWRGVADLYVWGEYRELPAEGLPFAVTPTEIRLTLWDGRSPPRVEIWRGTASEWEGAGQSLSAALTSALRPGPPPAEAASAPADPLTVAAALVRAQAEDLEKRHGTESASVAFLTSELGRAVRAQRVRLLELASFLEPRSLAVAEALHRAGLPTPDDATIDELWRSDASLLRIRELIPDSAPTATHAMMAERRIEVLEKLINRLGHAASFDAEPRRRQLRRVGERWSAEVRLATRYPTLVAAPDAKATSFQNERLLFVDDIDATSTGSETLLRLFSDHLNVLGPPLREMAASNPKVFRRIALKIIRLNEAVGREDQAYSELLALLSAPTADASPSASLQAAPARQTSSGAAAAPTDRPPEGPDWGAPETFPPALPGPELPLNSDDLAWWAPPPAYLDEALYRPYSRREVLLRPDALGRPPAILGFDGHRLWLQNPPLPDARPADRVGHALALASPYTDGLEPVAPLLPELRTSVTGIAVGADSLFLATAFDGLWQLGPAAGQTRRHTLAEGLPSLKLAAIALSTAGPVVLTAEPEPSFALLDLGGSWRMLPSPPPPAASTPVRPSGRLRPEPRPTAPLLAAAGPWVLYAGARNLLFDTRSFAWTPLVGLASESPSASWRHSPARAALADGEAFWLGGEFGLVRLDPAHPERESLWQRDHDVLALADGGAFLWVASLPPLETSATPDGARPRRLPPGMPPGPQYQIPSPDAQRTLLSCWDKANARWIGHRWIHDPVERLVAAPGRLYAAGARYWHVFDTLPIDPPARRTPAAFAGPDLAGIWAGLSPSTLLAAIARDDLPAVRGLLETRNSPPAPGWESALHVAASHAGPAVLDALLAAGADPNQPGLGGRLPLALAAERGEVSLMRRLLAAGADPSRQARLHLPDWLPRDPSRNGPPATEAPDPVTAGRAELLPDGRVRLTWSPARGATHYTIYRFDPRAEYTEVNGRNGRNDRNWKQLGRSAYQVTADVREWIDLAPSPPGVLITYHVIAENVVDRYGPPHPIPTAEIRAPAAGEVLPRRFHGVPPWLQDAPPLVAAAAGGHPGAIQILLQASADPRGVSAGRHHALHLALHRGHPGLIDTLVNTGVPLDARPHIIAPPRDRRPLPQSPETALETLYALRQDKTRFLQLLEAGADPGWLAAKAAGLGRREDVELILAAEPAHQGSRDAYIAALVSRRPNLARDLRERCLPADDPLWNKSSRDDLTSRALEAALRARDEENTGWLLARGASVKAGRSHDLPLSVAVRADFPAGVKLLLRHGARKDALSASTLAEATTPELVEALSTPADHSSAHARSPTATQPARDTAPAAPVFPMPWSDSRTIHYYLVGPAEPPQLAADQHAIRAQEETLRSAATSGNLHALQAALAAGARIDAYSREGRNALMLALEAGQPEAVRALIDLGASLNMLDRRGASPLAYAAVYADDALVGEMLDLGADPNLVGDSAFTPLVIALRDRETLIDPLLAAGADPRLICRFRGTGYPVPPLYHAAALGRLERVHRLVKVGADPRAVLWRGGAQPPTRGPSALAFAAVSGDAATLDYFLQLGLDPHLTDRYGDNALDWALQQGGAAEANAAKLRSLGVKTRTERGLPVHD